MLKQSFKNKSIGALLSASALAMGMGFSQSAQASDPFIAEIKMFGGNFAPRGYAFCDGQLLPIQTNQALFSLLGTTYGGDGRTTFGLPDLRGRSPVHNGQSTGPGLSLIRLGQKGGAESHTLTVNQIPTHNHAATATVHATDTSGNSAVPSGNILASKSRTNIYSNTAPDVTLNAASATVSIGHTGGNQSFGIRSPYLGVNFIIALQGIFPSRN